MHLSIVLFLSVLSTVLPTIYAAPYQHTDLSLQRRTTYTIDDKSAVTGQQLSAESHGKSTVYRLTKWDTQTDPGMVLKKYSVLSLKENEIDCLEAVGQLVAFDKKQNIVVMKEVKGRTLTQVLASVSDKAERKKAVAQWQEKVAKVAAQIAKDKKIYHNDLNEDNVIISDKNEITLIDWDLCAKKGTSNFIDDAAKIQEHLKTVWDSSGTKKP